MSIMEANTLDMSAILMQAYNLGDCINGSFEVADYLYWKTEVESSQEVQSLIKLLDKKKELFEECQRFGHFHPDYHSAMDQVKEIQARLEHFESVQKYKKAEEQLDDLLFTISKTIAYSVSDMIKVPSNVSPEAGNCSSGGCSTGGGCSGNCG